MTYTDIILTILSIATGFLAIATFFKNAKKDNVKSGEDDGLLKADLAYIKTLLSEIKTDTKEINKMLETHSVDIARIEQDLKSAHKRIDDAISRIDALDHIINNGGV
jgi:5-bromo-4-chloroindolyl phosphate hydrolysis protein